MCVCIGGRGCTVIIQSNIEWSSNSIKKQPNYVMQLLLHVFLNNSLYNSIMLISSYLISEDECTLLCFETLSTFSKSIKFHVLELVHGDINVVAE